MVVEQDELKAKEWWAETERGTRKLKYQNK
jgi:hypothetical protein